MHIVVTGASSGIGEAIARQWAGHGARVSLVARRVDKLEALASELGGKAFPSDLAEPANAGAFLPAAEAAHGPVDVLVNNAGMQFVQEFTSVEPVDGERLLALNVLTPLRLSHAVLPGMVARRRGGIINVASVAGLVPTPNMVHYTASKFALAGASEALRWELRDTGVRVLTVYPGPVETAMMRAAVAQFDASSPASRLPAGTTAELARKVYAAFERNDARVIYPGAYTVARWLGPLAADITGRFSPRTRGRP